MAVPDSGKLEQHSITALTRDLLRSRRDGCLTVSRGAITRRIYLRDGMIIYASSTEPSDRLGEILVMQGKLSRADHRANWEQSQASNRLLGMTLVVNDRITLHDLYQGVTAQVVTIFNRLQKWRKGDYEFDEGRAPDPGTVLLRLPLALYLKSDTEAELTRKPAAKRSAGKKRAAAAKAPPAPAAEPAEPETIEIDVETPEPAAAAAAGTGTDEQQERIGEVSFLVQELRRRVGQDPGSLLGVAAEADRAAIQAAFHRIAKTLHPDRLPAGISPELALEAEEVFREVTAAAEAAEGERGRTGGGGAPAQPARHVPEEDQARRFFAKGREWIAKRNYWQATDALRQAVRIRPSEPIYRQYLGLALMQTKRLHEAEEHLVEATRLEPDNAAHLVNLGRIYRAGRVYRKARESFERALRIDPRNEHARDELSDLPEEPAPARKPDAGGLLKKFFGK